MRAMLFCTINDFAAYGNLSGYSVKGHHACPICEEDTSCYKRRAEGVLQWIFSDGLASVSIFVEDFDRQRHQREGVFASGATHTLTRRVQDSWVTVVGEVPPATLKAFSLSLERRK